MTYEFEGKSEKDAIDTAIAELGLGVDQFDVEILEIQKGGFFKKGFVKIRVHTDEVAKSREHTEDTDTAKTTKRKTGEDSDTAELIGKKISDSNSELLISFLQGILERMDYRADFEIVKSTAQELLINISGEQAPYVIGKHGKTLDSLQLFANIYLAKIGYPHIRASLDCENYRRHKEEAIIRKAYEIADRVSSTRHSILLEPMNPYERRIVHTALSDVNYIETKSEGNGLYKQVRVLYKGSSDK